MHSSAPPLSGYNQNNYTSRMSSISPPLSAYNPNQTGRMSQLTSLTLSPSSEFPSSLFPNDSEAKFVTNRRRNNVQLMDLNQIQQLKKENEDYLNTSRKAKQYATPTNRRSSVATVQPVFDGMRASMAPTTPSNNYIQF